MAPKLHYHVTVLSGCSCIPTESNVYYYLQFLSKRWFLLDIAYQILKRSCNHSIYCVWSMWLHLSSPPTNLHEPPSEEDWKQIEHRFNIKWNFPNCIGSLNGKHIMIRCPPNSHSLFYNYKGFFSIVLMALFDADYHFIYIDVSN